MLKFLVESPYERKLYRVDGESLLIGRSRAAAIPLLDEAARKRHVRIDRVTGGYRFTDLTKGETTRNGKAEAEGWLAVGDRLGIGTTVVTLQAILKPREESAPAPPADGTPDSTPVPPAEAAADGRSVRLDPGGEEGLTSAGLRSVLEINKGIVRENDEGRLLRRIMDAAVDLTGAERGFLVLRQGREIRVRVAHNLEGDPVRDPDLEISRSIARSAIEGRCAILSADAETDERWSGMESVAALRLRSVLSVPFLSDEGVLGALYLDNRFESGIFTQRHVSLIEAFADQAALAILNSRLTTGLRERERELERKNQEVRMLNARLAAELDEAREEVRSRQGELEFKYDYSQIVGRSPAIREVLTVLDKVTDLNVPVFIEGESGTGKELAARALHFNGPRRAARFVTENCSAVPETLIEKVLFGHEKGAFTGADRDAPGLFEQAHGGTLFLDEVADMSPEMQKKILRVLQEGEVRRVGGKDMRQVDVRIVCATNRDVDAMKDEGTFREDLYWRLVVVRLRIPPLRERLEDLPTLTDHFLSHFAEEMGMERKTLESGALDLLSRYAWPGNVRELSNELRRAMALADDRIGAETLSERVRSGSPSPALAMPGGRSLKEIVEEVERVAITRELARTEGNKTRAAAALGLSRLGLRNKIQRYGL